MKLHLFAILSLAAAMTFPAMGEDVLSSQKDKISYGIGMQIGRSITNSQIDVSMDALMAGIKSVVTGTKPLLDDNAYREAMGALQSQMQAKQAEQRKQMEAKNKELANKTKVEGEAFLAANKKKDGIITTPSGLQYKVVTMGTGAKPTTGDKVVAHYRGTLIDGTEFDNSYKRGEPQEFGVTGVIKGWTEALQLMPVGSKWQLFIPADLAYGDAGYRPKIAPGSVLQFDLELIGVKPKDTAAEKPAAEKKK